MLRRIPLRGLGEAPAVPAAMPTDSQGSNGQAYYEETKILVFSKQLGATDNLGDLAQYVDKTYDFVFLAVAGKSDGAFQVNFKDPGGRDIYSSPASNVNAVGTGQFPIPWSHGMVFPAGGKIGLALINQNGGVNNVELLLIGVARYPTSH